MTRRGKVYVHDQFAGVIEQHEDEFIFQYDSSSLLDVSTEMERKSVPLKIFAN